MQMQVIVIMAQQLLALFQVQVSSLYTISGSENGQKNIESGTGGVGKQQHALILCQQVPPDPRKPLDSLTGPKPKKSLNTRRGIWGFWGLRPRAPCDPRVIPRGSTWMQCPLHGAMAHTVLYAAR